MTFHRKKKVIDKTKFNRSVIGMKLKMFQIIFSFITLCCIRYPGFILTSIKIYLFYLNVHAFTNLNVFLRSPGVFSDQGPNWNINYREEEKMKFILSFDLVAKDTKLRKVIKYIFILYICRFDIKILKTFSS